VQLFPFAQKKEKKKEKQLIPKGRAGRELKNERLSMTRPVCSPRAKLAGMHFRRNPLCSLLVLALVGSGLAQYRGGR
jgi:hypothetical protein